MPAADDPSHEHLVGQLTRHQKVVFRYILSLVPDPAAAEDILQETNLALWRKAADFDETRPFLPWACRFALHQVRAWRRDRARDRHVFDDDVLDLLAAEGLREGEPPALEHGLRDCLARLPERQRQLILARYQPGASVEQLARERNTNANALSQTLHRIRRSLADCIERHLQAPHGTSRHV